MALKDARAFPDKLFDMTDEKLTISDVARIFNIPEALLEDPDRVKFGSQHAITEACIVVLAEYFNAKYGAHKRANNVFDMTDLELKIISNAKPRIKDYEPRMNAKSFEAGTVKVPIISFDDVFDSLIYSPAQKKIVAIEYPIHNGKKIELRRIDVSGINWDEIPDPPEMLATWDPE